MCNYSGFHMSIGKIRLLKCLKNLDLFVHGQLKTAIAIKKAIALAIAQRTANPLHEQK